MDNLKKTIIQKPRGTHDLLGQDVILYRNIIKILQKCASKYNYQEIITPDFEEVQLFLRTVGATSDIVQKEIYQFKDKGNRDLALRPEGTAGVVRAVIENKLYAEKKTLKYFYNGKMFRYERPQKGRQREFNQFGIEAIGVQHPLIDVEVMIMAFEMLEQLNLKNLSLNINFFGSDSTKEKYQNQLKVTLIEYKPHLCANCQEKMFENPFRVLDCKTCQNLNLSLPKIIDYLSENEKEYFNIIITNLKNHKISFIINNNLVRGLDYYNGIIFEIIADNSDLGLSQNTLVGGGRYDSLFSDLGCPVAVPALGFAFGMERLMLLLSNNKSINQTIMPQLQVIGFYEKAFDLMALLLQALRNDGYHVNGEYQLFKAKNLPAIITKKISANLLFLQDDNKAKFYSYKKQKMSNLTFNNTEELLKQIKINLLKEQ